MASSGAGRWTSAGVFTTGPPPESAVRPGDEEADGSPDRNGEMEQPDSASRTAKQRMRSTGRSLPRGVAQGNPASVVPPCGVGASSTSPSSRLSPVPGGHSGFGSSSVPTRNGRLTAEPSQYGEVSRPLK